MSNKLKVINKPVFQIDRNDLMDEYNTHRRDILLDTLPSKEELAEYILRDDIDTKRRTLLETLSREFGTMTYRAQSVTEMILESAYLIPSIQYLYDDYPNGFYLQVVTRNADGTILSTEMVDSEDSL